MYVLGEMAWVEDHKYQSPEIINEMMLLISHKVLCTLIADLLPQSWLSLLAGETRGISNHELVVIILQWVSENMMLMKISLGLFYSWMSLFIFER